MLYIYIKDTPERGREENTRRELKEVGKYESRRKYSINEFTPEFTKMKSHQKPVSLRWNDFSTSYV